MEELLNASKDRCQASKKSCNLAKESYRRVKDDRRTLKDCFKEIDAIMKDEVQKLVDVLHVQQRSLSYVLNYNLF